MLKNATSSFADDIAAYLRDELSSPLVPARLRDPAFDWGIQRFHDPRLPHTTVLQFRDEVYKWLSSQMTPAEHAEFRLKQMTDRQILETIYWKLFPPPSDVPKY